MGNGAKMGATPAVRKSAQACVYDYEAKSRLLRRCGPVKRPRWAFDRRQGLDFAVIEAFFAVIEAFSRASMPVDLPAQSPYTKRSTSPWTLSTVAADGGRVTRDTTIVTAKLATSDHSAAWMPRGCGHTTWVR